MSRSPSPIDARIHKEGYITDYSFLPISHGARNKVTDIFMKIGGLPMSATVVFSLEVINMTASNESKFTIKSQQWHGNEIVLHEIFQTSTSIKKSTTESFRQPLHNNQIHNERFF
jgi:hypothetical protein